jgi:F-type H+-transporting ATPase subunit epsilon
MTITVLTPDREIFKGNITSVKVPGTLGEFQVLKGHAPIVSSLEAGKVSLVTAEGEHRVFDEVSGSVLKAADVGKKITFQIGGGFIEVLNNEVSLLVRGVKEMVK